MTLLVILSLAIGVSVALQGSINGALAGRVGLVTAVLVNAAIGFSVALIWWLAAPRFAPVGERPPVATWMWLGGFVGMIILVSAAYTFPRFGAGPTLSLVVLAQLTTGLLLDHYGWSGRELAATPTRILGAFVILIGAWMILRPTR